MLAVAGFRLAEAQAQEMLAAYRQLARMKARLRSSGDLGVDPRDISVSPDVTDRNARVHR